MKYVYIGYGSEQKLINKLPKEDRPTIDSWYGACVLLDDEDNFVKIVGYEGQEPEDNTLYRDYSWVIPELNKLAKTIQDLEGEINLLETGLI